MARAPFDVVNEQAILASMLCCSQCRRRAMGSLSASDFQGVRHRVLYTSISACELNGIEPDKANVAVHAEDEDFGGVEYVDKLVSMGIAEGIEHNLERLKRESARRKAMGMLPAVEEVLNNREKTHTECLETVAEMGRTLRNVSARVGTHGAAKHWLENFQKRCDGEIPFVPTGYDSLDAILVEGLAHRRITVVAGRPGAGKSTTAVDLVRRQLEMAKKPRILVLPNESGRDRFLDMLISSSTGVDAERIIKRADGLMMEEKERIRRVAKKIAGTDDRLEVMDNPFLMLSKKGRWGNDAALDKLEEILADGGYDIVMMDLFQRMLTDTATQQINAALVRVQALFQKYETHGVLLHQLSRKADDRSKDKSRRPTLADLKDAGAYEEVADLVLLLHRERIHKSHLRDDLIEVKVAKQRVGEAGMTMVCDFEPWVFRLANDEVRDIEESSSFVPGEGVF